MQQHVLLTVPESHGELRNYHVFCLHKKEPRQPLFPIIKGNLLTSRANMGLVTNIWPITHQSSSPYQEMQQVETCLWHYPEPSLQQSGISHQNLSWSFHLKGHKVFTGRRRAEIVMKTIWSLLTVGLPFWELRLFLWNLTRDCTWQGYPFSPPKNIYSGSPELSSVSQQKLRHMKCGIAI